MLKAGKAGSVSCKTTVALLWGRGSRFDTGEGGPGSGGVSRTGCWLLCRAGSLLWQLILPPTCQPDLIYPTGFIKMWDCRDCWSDKLPYFRLEFSLQPTGFRNFKFSVGVAFLCLHVGHRMSPLELQGTAPHRRLLCNNKRNPATAFLPAQFSTLMQQGSRDLSGIHSGLHSQLVQYIFFFLELLLAVLKILPSVDCEVVCSSALCNYFLFASA